MIKKYIRIFGILTLIIFSVLVYIDQNRTFYCVSKNKCVTVWKRVGGVCYIIPYNYYGFVKPNDNYIQTDNLSDLDIIWTGNKNEIIVSKDENSLIVNNVKDEILIKDYIIHKRLYDSIYTVKEINYSRYKKNVDYMSIFIRENYAIFKDVRYE